jgi:hypothetical protein
MGIFGRLPVSGRIRALCRYSDSRNRIDFPIRPESRFAPRRAFAALILETSVEG